MATVTFKKRDVLADGVVVGEIIGYRHNHPRLGVTGGYGLKAVDGTWVIHTNTGWSMVDVKKEAVDYFGTTGSSGAAPQ